MRKNPINRHIPESGWRVVNGDSLLLLRQLPENSVDAIVTDPPYELTGKKKGGTGPASVNLKSPAGRSRITTGFMGKAWDGTGIAHSVEFWEQVLRVLKPGGHLVAFAGTRTYHRMTCAIEDAGFECRDMLAWMYGCLDDQTQVATVDGVKSYTELNVGDLALCYDISTRAYSYQPIQEIVEYDYNDTAYRLVGDFGEQVVSKNHRCIVEQGRDEVFQFAEEVALERQARVPFLENLSGLQCALSDLQQITSSSQQDMQCGVREYTDKLGQFWTQADRDIPRQEAGSVYSLPQSFLSEYQAPGSYSNAGVFTQMQRSCARGGMEEARLEGKGCVDCCKRSKLPREDEWSKQSSMEGRCDVSRTSRKLCDSEDQIREGTTALPGDGKEGRLRDALSVKGSACYGASTDASGGSASLGSRRHQQSADESDAVCYESGPQEVRAWSGHKTSMVRVVPFKYVGKVWCLRVPTSSFVAVRGGVAFPTGNSGFPKSQNVSAAIDRQAGVKPRVVGANPNKRNAHKHGGRGFDKDLGMSSLLEMNITAPTSPDAIKWDGFGTALKPAHEPICLARKPLSERTVAANVLRWGTGALNIDATRIQMSNADIDTFDRVPKSDPQKRLGIVGKDLFSYADFDKYHAATRASFKRTQNLGRWPANVCHDGSDEVIAGFPQRTGDGNWTGKQNGGAIWGSGQKGYRGSRPRLERSSEGTKSGGMWKPSTGKPAGPTYSDAGNGTVARFFYQAKTSTRERHEGLSKGHNTHPTVKPVALMRWLVRMIVPPGGVVIDPFTGSGSTGIAARIEGCRFIGIEKETEYAVIDRARIEQSKLYSEQPKPKRRIPDHLMDVAILSAGIIAPIADVLPKRTLFGKATHASVGQVHSGRLGNMGQRNAQPRPKRRDVCQGKKR